MRSTPRQSLTAPQCPVAHRCGAAQTVQDSSARGLLHWEERPEGTFVISSGQVTTAAAKWLISNDGRYCVVIDWKRAPTEDWCRFVITVGGACYATRSDKTDTERVHKRQIPK